MWGSALLLQIRADLLEASGTFKNKQPLKLNVRILVHSWGSPPGSYGMPQLPRARGSKAPSNPHNIFKPTLTNKQAEPTKKSNTASAAQGPLRSFPEEASSLCRRQRRDLGLVHRLFLLVLSLGAEGLIISVSFLFFGLRIRV